ncbi:hypothetical protein [Pseudomonas oligotrophica]|uniref:hypothetical protein n=1 Tax=Pseudomonas oligotrophica TaxID=2912055 RepID=UPI001F320A4D|nr:hypothetical protein [Pseudomonas oligotrophica]MCF7202887.1 hypothetical protein [Pseudomonas oligotrophica]
MRAPRCLIAGLCLLLATAVQPALGGDLLAQSSDGAPVDRAAGNGSMGTGEGIRRLEPQPDEAHDAARRENRPRRSTPSIEEPGHGGNETDMEHRRRPRLGDDRER